MGYKENLKKKYPKTIPLADLIKQEMEKEPLQEKPKTYSSEEIKLLRRIRKQASMVILYYYEYPDKVPKAIKKLEEMIKYDRMLEVDDDF